MKKLICAVLMVTAGAAMAAALIATRTIGDTSRVASRVISTTPCKLFAVTGYNSFGSTQYVFVFESGAVPTNGQAGKLGPFPVAAGQWYSVDLSAYGADLDAVTVGVSTSDSTFTNSATNCTIQAVIAR
jgi:hypothetical protein